MLVIVSISASSFCCQLQHVSQSTLLHNQNTKVHTHKHKDTQRRVRYFSIFSTRMATKAKIVQQKEVIAIDCVALYKALAEAGEAPGAVSSQAAFGAAWDAAQMEAIFYSATSLSDSDPFIDSIVMQYLEVAAAYLHLDPWQAPAALGFGLLLASYVYFTQPSLMQTPQAEEGDTAAAAERDDATGAETSLPPPSSAPRRRYRIKIGIAAYRTLLERIPLAPNADLLRHTLASLVAADAFAIAPHANNGPAVAAIVTAHALFGAPIVDVGRLARETAQIESTLTKELEAIEARRRAVAVAGGVADEDGGDAADFVMPIGDDDAEDPFAVAPSSSSAAVNNFDDDDDLNDALRGAGICPTSAARPKPSAFSSSAASAAAAGAALPSEAPDFGTDRAAMRKIMMMKDQYLQQRKGLL